VDLNKLKREFLSANPKASANDCLAFCRAAYQALHGPPPDAQDSVNFSALPPPVFARSLDIDPSTVIDPDPGDKPMPNNNGVNMPPRGGSTSGYVNGDFMDQLPSARLRNGGRDQTSVAPPPGPMSTTGAYTANLDQGDPDDNGNGEMTGAELHSIMQLCRARLSPEEQDNFDMLNRMSHNGNGGDRGMRAGSSGAARDQTPPRPPSQPSLPRPGGSNTMLDRRRAQDRRIAQDAAQALNTSSFLKRFPEARGIKFSANGRY
jgi:hypothetical protein